jgi:hypothetical protein
MLPGHRRGARPRAIGLVVGDQDAFGRDAISRPYSFTGIALALIASARVYSGSGQRPAIRPQIQHEGRDNHDRRAEDARLSQPRHDDSKKKVVETATTMANDAARLLDTHFAQCRRDLLATAAEEGVPEDSAVTLADACVNAARRILVDLLAQQMDAESGRSRTLPFGCVAIVGLLVLAVIVGYVIQYLQ